MAKQQTTISVLLALLVCYTLPHPVLTNQFAKLHRQIEQIKMSWAPYEESVHLKVMCRVQNLDRNHFEIC